MPNNGADGILGDRIGGLDRNRWVSEDSVVKLECYSVVLEEKLGLTDLEG